MRLLPKNIHSLKDFKTADYYSEKAQRAYRAGDVFTTIKMLRKCVELAPDDDGFLLALAQHYAECGYVVEARRRYFEALEAKNPDFVSIYLGLAMICSADEDYDGAFHYGAKALTACGKDEGEKEMCRLILSEAVDIMPWDLTDEYIARRNLISLVGSNPPRHREYYYEYANDDDCGEDYLPFDEALKKQSVGFYNKGNLKDAVKTMKRRAEIFDGDSKHFLNFYSLCPNSKTEIISEAEFEVPAKLENRYIDCIVSACGRGLFLNFDKPMLADAVEWAFENDIRPLIDIITYKLHTPSDLRYGKIIQHWLTHIECPSAYLTYKLPRLAYVCLPYQSRINFCSGNRLYATAFMPYGKGGDNAPADGSGGGTEFFNAVDEWNFELSYMQFLPALILVKPGSEQLAARVAEGFLARMEEREIKRFKARGALAAVMLEAAMIYLKIPEAPFSITEIFGTTRATINKYKELLFGEDADN